MISGSGLAAPVRDGSAAASGDGAGADSRSVAIVGGGLLGMAVALRLRAAGHAVTIYEAAPAVGGLASAARIGRFTWDRFYHVILMSDATLRRWLDELDLTGELQWGVTRTGFLVDNRLLSLSTTAEFLRFPPLRLIDTVRLGATILYASRIRNWRRLERVTATAWLRRWSGVRAYERLWLPLLRAKLGSNHSIASAAFIWAIIARMYSARRSGMKREVFGYVRGGYATILDRFTARLTAAGVTIRAGQPVAEVRTDGGAARLTLASGEVVEADAALLTVPCGRVAAICPELPAQEKARLQGVVYQGIVCVSLLLRRPLGGYYVTNIADAAVPFTAIIEMTALVDREAFDGRTLVYLPRYLVAGDRCWGQSDDDIVSEFVAALRRIYPELREDDVEASLVSRVREMLAVTTVGYSDELLPPVRTSDPRVMVVNSAQIAQGTLNVNETLALADAKLPEVLRSLASLPQVQHA